MNCPNCNQSNDGNTFLCDKCGCKVFHGQISAYAPKKPGDSPAFKITPHGVMSGWRFFQMMIGGTVVTGIGIVMILIDALLYGIFLICVGIGVFAYGIWSTLKAR